MHDPQDLERADDAVTGGCKIAEDKVTALFAAEIKILRNHFLNHVAIAHFSANDFAAVGGERFVQSEVTHFGRDQRVVAELIRFQKIERGDSKNFIAINDFAVFVAEQHAVGVAIMSDADIGASEFDDALNFVRVRAAAALVDVHSIRLVMRHGDIGAEFAQNAGGRFVSGAVRDIDCDAQFFERHLSWETRLREFDVAAKRVVNARGASNLARRRTHVVDLPDRQPGQ